MSSVQNIVLQGLVENEFSQFEKTLDENIYHGLRNSLNKRKVVNPEIWSCSSYSVSAMTANFGSIILRFHKFEFIRRKAEF